MLNDSNAYLKGLPTHLYITRSAITTHQGIVIKANSLLGTNNILSLYLCKNVTVLVYFMLKSSIYDTPKEKYLSECFLFQTSSPHVYMCTL